MNINILSHLNQIERLQAQQKALQAQIDGQLRHIRALVPEPVVEVSPAVQEVLAMTMNRFWYDLVPADRRRGTSAAGFLGAHPHWRRISPVGHVPNSCPYVMLYDMPVSFFIEHVLTNKWYRGRGFGKRTAEKITQTLVELKVLPAAI